MLFPVITFTCGWISIRRGKILRKYYPKLASFRRISNLLNPFDAPCEKFKSTNRSTVYRWCGESSLSDTQKILLNELKTRIENYESYKPLEHKDWHPGDMSERDDLMFVIGYREACRNSGIHELLLEYNRP